MSFGGVAAGKFRIELVSAHTECTAPNRGLAAPANAVPRNALLEQSVSEFNMATDSMPQLLAKPEG